MDLNQSAQTLKTLLVDLNKDLSLEYAAAIQYIQHYGMLTGPQYMTIRNVLSEHASEEVGHALTLSDLIAYYGGVSEKDCGKVLTANSTADMLKDDLATENVAIQRYRKRVKDAEDLGLFELGTELRKILTDELDHANELKLALGK